jgi:hypothetical protein
MGLSVNVNCALRHGLGRVCKPLLVVDRRTKSESNAGSEMNQAHMKPKKRDRGEKFAEY